MPVQVRHDVAETGEIDLVGPQQFAQQAFDCINDVHQAGALSIGEIRHFRRVLGQDHAAESRVIVILHEHHAHEAIVPQHFSAGRNAELAGWGGHGYQISAHRAGSPHRARHG